MNRFGAGSIKDLETIAEIIEGENLDIVAFQEIFSGGKGLERILSYLPNWELVFATPTETIDPEKINEMIKQDTRGEGYAYMWNTKRFEKVVFTRLGEERVFEPRIINSLSKDVHVNCDIFARVPYYIRLQPKSGGFFELRLINIHIYFGDNSITAIEKRKIEFDILANKIYPEICKNRYGTNRPAYTIAMGDYNLNIFSPPIQTQDNCFLTQVYTHYDGQEISEILTIQDQLTTLKKSDDGLEEVDGWDMDNALANNYDHFTYSPQMAPFKRVSCSAIDAINNYYAGLGVYYFQFISDHLPIVMEIEI